MPETPEIKAYVERVNARPAIQRADAKDMEFGKAGRADDSGRSHALGRAAKTTLFAAGAQGDV